ncbi:MAG TPA: hypothetical protein VFQ91_09555 [Bryobacteraceae bacterium]|nr:hypothetical protein [Bryobacteraceae bacterium]
MRILGLAAAGFTLFAWGQPDPSAVLARARERAKTAAAGLSHYACSQTVQRETYKPRHGNPFAEDRKKKCQEGSPDQQALARRDRVRWEVTVDEGKELFSWPGESRTEQGGAYALAADGLVTTGDFAAFLTDVFQRQDIRFVRWEGKTPENIAVYRYAIPASESQYAMDTRRGKRTRMAYGGEVWVDSQTGDPRRLTVAVDRAPKGTGTCRLETTISYGRVEKDWLRPVETRVEMWEEDWTRYVNRTTFTACRTFGSESVLRTDLPPDTAPEVRQDRVPDGLRARMRLRQAITAEKAAAGDAVEAELTSDVRDASGHVAAAAGTVVRGRIVRATHTAWPSWYFVLALHFPGFRPASSSTSKRELATDWEKKHGAGVYLITGEKLTTGVRFETEWTTSTGQP